MPVRIEGHLNGMMAKPRLHTLRLDAIAEWIVDVDTFEAWQLASPVRHRAALPPVPIQ